MEDIVSGIVVRTFISFIPPCEMYEAGMIIITPVLQRRNWLLNGILETEFMQPDSELAILTIYFIPPLLAFAFGVMFRNAFHLSSLCKHSPVFFQYNYGYLFTYYLIKCFIP